MCTHDSFCAVSVAYKFHVERGAGPREATDYWKDHLTSVRVCKNYVVHNTQLHALQLIHLKIYFIAALLISTMYMYVEIQCVYAVLH